jgi:hypothetical protein
MMESTLVIKLYYDSVSCEIQAADKLFPRTSFLLTLRMDLQRRNISKRMIMKSLTFFVLLKVLDVGAVMIGKALVALSLGISHCGC